MRVSFSGIKPKHTLGNVTVYPLKRDLSLKDVSAIRRAVKPEAIIGHGCNGDVFAYKNDYVIKRNRPNALINTSVMGEAEKLDMFLDLEKEHGRCPNMQSGIGAIELPDGTSFLISTRMKGKKMHPFDNPLNKKNLTSLMKSLTILDKGTKKHGRFMTYDLNPNNINITPSEANLFDFEYTRGLNYEELIRGGALGVQKRTSAFFSDTSGLHSNVKSFEWAALNDYLTNLNPDEAKGLYKHWLNLKSDYHKEMSAFFKEKAKNSDCKKEFLELSRREAIHAKMLKKPDETVYKAEAAKMQMARFVYSAGPYCVDRKFNPNQIVKYYDKYQKFLNNAFDEAVKKKDADKQTYLKDCLNLFDRWSDIRNVTKSTFDERQKRRMSPFHIKTVDSVLF